MTSPPDRRRRPATSCGSGTRVTGRCTLNLMQSLPEAMAEAGLVESLPAETLVILRVSGSPDPAVVNRLRAYGGHVRYEVHGREGASTGAWVRALREGMRWTA